MERHSLCRATGCGFAGSPVTDGYCSQCYKDKCKVLLRIQALDAPAEEADRKKKNRCPVCRKKLGFATGFTCRCGGLFCSLHRYSNEHDCTFDYRNLGAEEIRKNNPLVVGEKVAKL